MNQYEYDEVTKYLHIYDVAVNDEYFIDIDGNKLDLDTINCDMFSGVTLTLEHPDKRYVDAENYREESIGVVKRAWLDGGVLKSDIIIKDIDVINWCKRNNDKDFGFSLGYFQSNNDVIGDGIRLTRPKSINHVALTVSPQYTQSVVCCSLRSTSDSFLIEEEKMVGVVNDNSEVIVDQVTSSVATPSPIVSEGIANKEVNRVGGTLFTNEQIESIVEMIEARKLAREAETTREAEFLQYKEFYDNHKDNIINDVSTAKGLPKSTKISKKVIEGNYASELEAPEVSEAPDYLDWYANNLRNHVSHKVYMETVQKEREKWVI